MDSALPPPSCHRNACAPIPRWRLVADSSTSGSSERSNGASHGGSAQKRTSSGDMDNPGPPNKRRKKTTAVDFKDIFQDGKPKGRCMLTQHPLGVGKWYMFICHDHDRVFDRVRGAVNHLRTHLGKGPKTIVDAIREMGIEVLGCNESLALQYNQALKSEDTNDDGSRGEQMEVDDSGNEDSGDEDSGDGDSGDEESGDEASGDEEYEAQEPRVEGVEWPVHEPGVEGPVHESGYRTATQPAVPRQKPAGVGAAPPVIVDPVIGEIYRAFWGRMWFAVIRLPVGPLDVVGISGHFRDTGFFRRKIPRGYEVDMQRETLSWANGFRDGQARVGQRRFPMLYLDDKMNIPVSASAEFGIPIDLGQWRLLWASARVLREFTFDDPECQRVRGYQAAQALCNRIGALKFREADAFGSARMSSGMS